MRATMRFLAMSGAMMTGFAARAAPAAEFARENFCERYVVWNRDTQRFDYAPVGTARAIR